MLWHEKIQHTLDRIVIYDQRLLTKMGAFLSHKNEI